MPPLVHLVVFLLYLSSLLALLLLAALAFRTSSRTAATIHTRTATRTTTSTRMEQSGEARRSQGKVKIAREKGAQEKAKVSRVSRLQVPQEDSIRAAFLAACGQGEEEKVRAAILLGVDVNVRGENRRTGLISAVYKNHKAVVGILLEQARLDINMVGSPGTSALMVAAMFGHSWVIARLGSRRELEGVNREGPQGDPPLLWAVKQGHVECVRELLQLEGMEVNTVDQKGRTALMWAAQMGKVVVLQLLLGAAGVEVGRVTTEGRTAEALARESGQGPQVLALLPGTPENVRGVVGAMEGTLRNLKLGGGGAVPECPVCKGSLAPPTWIFQCGRGHLLCGSCKPRVQVCPRCSGAVGGRAVDMERYLRGELPASCLAAMAISLASCPDQRTPAAATAGRVALLPSNRTSKREDKGGCRLPLPTSSIQD